MRKKGLEALLCTITSHRFEGVLIWEEKLLIFFGLGTYGISTEEHSRNLFLDFFFPTTANLQLYF